MGRPKKIKEPKAETLIIPEKVEEEVPSTFLPIIEGSQAIEIIEENETATLYRLANGTTTWIPKK